MQLKKFATFKYSIHALGFIQVFVICDNGIPRNCVANSRAPSCLGYLVHLKECELLDSYKFSLDLFIVLVVCHSLGFFYA